jgi:hypothetical protein
MLCYDRLNFLVSFKSVYSMAYWLENVYIITSIRSCPFSQGAIYKPQERWSNMWGLDEPDGHSQGFRGVNSTRAVAEIPFPLV